MKYEDPKMEVIELVAREVFMDASKVTGTGGGDNENGEWKPGDDDF